MIFLFISGIFFLLVWIGMVFFLPGDLKVGLRLVNGTKLRFESAANAIKAFMSYCWLFVINHRVTRWSGPDLHVLQSGMPLGKFLGVAVLVAVPVLVGTFSMSAKYRLLMPVQSKFANESQVSQMMNEAPLVPPSALPPSVFAASADQQLEFADRDWQKIDSGLMQHVLQLIAGMKVYGYQLVLLEGYRSPERQEMLASRGASVTRANAYQSKHQYGLAVDMAFLREGKLVIDETDPWAMAGYKQLGLLAKQEGLIWGGGWSMQDYGHIESSKSIKYLASQYGAARVTVEKQ